MSFGEPMVWTEITNSVMDCYICLRQMKGFPDKSKRDIRCGDVSSVIKPQLHFDDLPVPETPVQCLMAIASNNSMTLKIVMIRILYLKLH